MKALWISCSRALPRDGEPVQFRVSSHEIGLRGTYAEGQFRSRWACYAARRIDSWHALDINPGTIAIPVVDPAHTEASVSLLKRLRGLIAGQRGVALQTTTPVRVGAREPSGAAPPMRIRVVRSHANDSNQMSS